MAIFRASALVGAISGNLGGACFVQSKSGPVVRQRIRRTRTTNKNIIQIRTALQVRRHTWQGLTEDQRIAWRQAALVFHRVNRLGVSSRLSGFALFMKVNLFAWDIGGFVSILLREDPPDLTRYVPWEFVDFTAEAGSDPLLTLTQSITSENTEAILYGARTFSSATRATWSTFAKVQRLTLFEGPRAIPGFDDAVGPPVAGEQIWLKIFQRSPDNIPTGPSIHSTIVTAP